jgi:hypothetical protein
MIIAVPVVRVVQVPIDQVVDVVAVGDGFVAAVGAVDVAGVVGTALMIRRAGIGVRRCHVQDVFVDMIAVRMMQMPIVQIIGVSVVLDRRVATSGAMRVIVVLVFVAGIHDVGSWSEDKSAAEL